MSEKYLDYDGLVHLWGKIKDYANNISAESDGAIPLIKVNSNNVSVDPNKYYQVVNPQANLVIKFESGSDNAVLNHYMVEFPYDGGSVTFPSNLNWAYGIPELENGYTYQLSSINNLAILIKFRLI